MDTAIRTEPPTAPIAAHRSRRPGRYVVRAVGGPHLGEHYELHEDRLVRGGRGVEANDIVLTRDTLVSRVHFSLEMRTDGLVLRDLDSRNGVYVGAARVPEATLPPGAVFKAGDSALQLASLDDEPAPLSTSDHFGDLHGWSPVMRALFARLERIAAVAHSTLPLLITGATGTGKELVARGLHARSSRAGGPFIVLDCTALPPNLADAIVFGYSRGAFSGALADHAGVFEAADGGTLFIDELGELPLDVQAKLLRVLDRREVSRFDDRTRVRKVDVRLVCATNRDLQHMVLARTFREDLYYRVLGQHVVLPALHERDDDAVRLADRFVATHCERLGIPRKTLSARARQAVHAAPWPGNVRELLLAIQRAVEASDRDTIEARDLAVPHTTAASTDLALPLRLPWERAQEAFQTVYLRNLLQRVGSVHGWINAAAAQAGMDRSGLVKALKRLGLYDRKPDPDPID